MNIGGLIKSRDTVDGNIRFKKGAGLELVEDATGDIYRLSIINGQLDVSLINDYY